jgi:hypothetical protein
MKDRLQCNPSIESIKKLLIRVASKKRKDSLFRIRKNAVSAETIDKPFFIEMQLQRFKNGIDATCTLPTSKGVVDQSPWAETFWQISPRHTSVEYPESAIEHLAWVASTAFAYAVMHNGGSMSPHCASVN